MMSETRIQMTDWAGMPIHVGDTVVFVKTIQPRIFHMFDYLDPETKELCKLRVLPKIPQHWVWQPAWETEITLIDGIPHLQAPLPNPQTGKPGLMVPVNMFWDMYCDQNMFTGNVFAIKGISDNHEKFFRNFFRRGIMNRN
jgi:hypothetical protein